MKEVTDARKLRGLTQGQLSLASNVSPPMISHIEKGKKSPTVRTLQKIAKALDAKLIIEFVPNEDLEDI